MAVYDYLLTTREVFVPRQVDDEDVLSADTITPSSLDYFSPADMLLFLQENAAADLLALEAPEMLHATTQTLLYGLTRWQYGVQVQGGLLLGRTAYEREIPHCVWRPKRHSVGFRHCLYVEPNARNHNRSVKRLVAKKRRSMAKSEIRAQLLEATCSE
jgi:hypothetical protein